MNRIAIAAAVVYFVIVLSAFAAQSEQPLNDQGATFEQKQARILNNFNAQIANLQEAKTCVQSARSNDDLRDCRQQYMAKLRERQGGMEQHRGTTGSPHDGTERPQEQ